MSLDQLEKRRKIIRGIKFLLPTIAFFTAVAIVAWPSFHKETIIVQDEATPVVEEQKPQSLGVVDPHYRGVDQKKRPFTIKGSSAKEEYGRHVVLKDFLGDLELENGAWVALKSDDAKLDQKRDELDLNGDVTFFHENGHEFRTKKAFVDLKNGTAEGNDIVKGQGNFGTIESEGFKIIDSGKKIVFTGKAKLLFR